MSTMNEAYENRLLIALRLRGVPGSKIGQILAEVQAHSAESGEDPTSTFGSPESYAKQFDAPSRLRAWVPFAAIMAGLGLLPASVIEVLGSGHDVFGLRPAVTLVLSVLLLGLGLKFYRGRFFSLMPIDPVIDPRDGKDITFAPTWMKLLLGAAISVPVILGVALAAFSGIW